jgi:MinD superfamily P-loop ATPase
MKLAIASGKGGTGKTTVAINLALAAEGPVHVIDCDVEEPNAHLFLRTEGLRERVVSLPVPKVDPARCDGCGKCSRFCKFNAIACFGAAPYISPELCHACGGCVRVCPQRALREVPHRIGMINTSRRGDLTLVEGRLDVGVVWIPPLIREVKETAPANGLVIIDAPPGTACPVAVSLMDSDFVVLVAEPTPFGLNDLSLAVEVVRQLGLAFGVVINRAGSGDDRVKDYCRAQEIAVLTEIPDDRRIAEAYSRGTPLVEALPEYKSLFARLLDRLAKEVAA